MTSSKKSLEASKLASLYKLRKNLKLNNELEKTCNVHLKSANQVLGKILGEIQKMPPNGQLIVSSTSGWFIGFVTLKIGRLLALSIGGGLILMQIAQAKGIISINWDKINRSLPQEESSNHIMPKKVKTLVDFAMENISLFMGLLGGFLIGLATS